MEANVMNVSPNFISFMQIPLLAGRNMESDSDMFVDDVFRDKNGKDILGMSLYNYQMDIQSVVYFLLSILQFIVVGQNSLDMCFYPLNLIIMLVIAI